MYVTKCLEPSDMAALELTSHGLRNACELLQEFVNICTHFHLQLATALAVGYGTI